MYFIVDTFTSAVLKVWYETSLTCNIVQVKVASKLFAMATKLKMLLINKNTQLPLAIYLQFRCEM